VDLLVDQLFDVVAVHWSHNATVGQVEHGHQLHNKKR
jgi:hypothetical protein